MRHIILFAFVFLAFQSGAQAQRQLNVPITCVNAEGMTRTLEAQYGEKLDQVGVTRGGGILNFYIGDNSWTVTIRLPEAPGFECILTTGETWQRRSEVQAPSL